MIDHIKSLSSGSMYEFIITSHVHKCKSIDCGHRTKKEKAMGTSSFRWRNLLWMLRKDLLSARKSSFVECTAPKGRRGMSYSEILLCRGGPMCPPPRFLFFINARWDTPGKKRHLSKKLELAITCKKMFIRTANKEARKDACGLHINPQLEFDEEELLPIAVDEAGRCFFCHNSFDQWRKWDGYLVRRARS